METNEKKRVLIIDDEKMNILALAQFLNDKYEVLVALSGDEGLSVIEKNPPDIILLDVIMHGLTGFDVIDKVKKDEKTKNIPVIFLSGMAYESNIEKGLRLGAADFIGKPFEKAIVQKRIETHLRLAELEAKLV